MRLWPFGELSNMACCLDLAAEARAGARTRAGARSRRGARPPSAAARRRSDALAPATEEADQTARAGNWEKYVL